MSEPPTFTPPVQPLQYEAAVHQTWVRVIRLILWIGVAMAVVGLARACMETLGAFGLIAIPSWLVRMSSDVIWSLPATIALIAGWGLNIALLLGTLMALQRRPKAAYALRRYAHFSIGFQLFWLLCLWAYIYVNSGAFEFDALFIDLSVLGIAMASCIYPVLMLLLPMFPPAREIMGMTTRSPEAITESHVIDIGSKEKTTTEELPAAATSSAGSRQSDRTHPPP